MIECLICTENQELICIGKCDHACICYKCS